MNRTRVCIMCVHLCERDVISYLLQQNGVKKLKSIRNKERKVNNGGGVRKRFELECGGLGRGTFLDVIIHLVGVQPKTLSDLSRP